MVRAGLEKIEKAKKNGSWTILDEMENLIVPPDLEEALKRIKRPETIIMFLLIQLKNRSCGLLSVPRSETRKKRIENVIEATKRNKKPFYYL